MIELSAARLKLFDVARRAALTSEYGKFRHGAVLARRTTIVSVGCNAARPTKFGKRFRAPAAGQATVHAELACILNLPVEHTNGADVYVVRINPQGQLRMSAPCAMCQAALRHVGVSRVFFSTNDGFDVIKL